jgi:LuxR family maltose regulon positive regulatory protein
MRRLDLARERTLTLVSAPAGFGKTTLLGEWLQSNREDESPLPGTWLSLDIHDNDPARFTTYVVAALRKVETDLGSEIETMLKAGQTLPIDGIWEYLISEIACIPSPFVLVLDDYHVIENPLIHQCLAFLFEQMPPAMNLVISSRSDPPIPLSRLRVRDELAELRASDLRFNSEEMAEFLALWIGKQLSATDHAELEARTEGWIAGLQLAALAMQNLLETEPEEARETSLSSFVHRLSGNTHFILDYLAEEVLRRQPEAVRSFLLKTCILERLTAPLCDALMDGQGSQNILTSLEKENIFLFPLDDERAWFRYHTLFADLLRSTLQHQQPALVVDLHRKARAWYESQGYFAEAVHHALQTPDPGEAARLMEKVAIDTLMSGEIETVLRWAGTIPDDQAKIRPALCAAFGWAFILSGKMDQAMRYLHLPDQGSVSQESLSACPTVEIALARAMIAYCMEDFENAFRYAQQVSEQLPQEPTYLHGMLKFILGAAYEMVGQDQAAFQACQEARKLNHAFDNRISELYALGRIGDLQVRRGQLHQAFQTYQQALQLGEFRGDRLLPVAALPVFAMGRLLFEWNRLAEAEQYLLQSTELSRKLGNRFTLLSSLLFLACIQLVRGEKERAFELQKEADQVGVELPSLPATVAPIALLRLRLCLLQGDTQAAIRLAQIQEMNWSTPCAFSQEIHAFSGRARGSPREIQPALWR